MRCLSLKQLEAFYWAATCDSFATAADKLHISQSSLSKRIVEMESSLGRALFDRSGRRSTLTAEGRALHSRARTLLNQVDELVASIGADTLIGGRCRLGVGEIAASSWLPKLVSRLGERHPQLELEPYVDLGLELETKLVSGKLDAAMIAYPSTHPDLESVLLAEVEYIWVARSDKIDGACKVEDLVKHLPVVTMSRQAGSTRILDSWRHTSQVIIPDIIESNSMVTMAGLISAGVAIGYLPHGWLQPLLRNGTLKILHSNTPLTKLQYKFYWRSDDTRPLLAGLREVALEMVDYDTPLLML